MASSSNDAVGLDDLARLLTSLPLRATDEQGATPLDGRAAHALASRLTDILGQSTPSKPIVRNEKGQILNEQGLPVIEITEPVLHPPPSSLEAVKSTLATQHARFSTLTEAQRAERRREIDHILDELEKEEDELERDAAASEEKEGVSESRRQKELAVQNMARALALSTPNFRPLPPDDEDDKSEHGSPPKPTLHKATKKVTFAEDESIRSNSQEAGDVVIGRLRKPMSPLDAINTPVKLRVTEHIPGTSSAVTSVDAEMAEDSDDEQWADEDADELFIAEDGFDADSAGDDYEDPDAGDDLQNEVALEYSRKRKEAEARGGAFVGFGRLAVPKDGWDDDEMVTADDTNAVPKSQAFSRFKSARLARSLLSRKTVGNLSPATNDRELAGYIRRGKLDISGQLVPPDESVEEDQLGYRAQEVIEALRRGETADLSNIPQRKPRGSPSENVRVATSLAVAPDSSMSPSASISAEPPSVRTTLGSQDSLDNALRPLSRSGVSYSNQLTVESSRKPLSSGVVERRIGTTTKPLLFEDATHVGEITAGDPPPVAPNTNKARVSRFKTERAAR